MSVTSVLRRKTPHETNDTLVGTSSRSRGARHSVHKARFRRKYEVARLRGDQSCLRPVHPRCLLSDLVNSMRPPVAGDARSFGGPFRALESTPVRPCPPGHWLETQTPLRGATVACGSTCLRHSDVQSTRPTHVPLCLASGSTNNACLSKSSLSRARASAQLDLPRRSVLAPTGYTKPHAGVSSPQIAARARGTRPAPRRTARV